MLDRIGSSTATSFTPGDIFKMNLPKQKLFRLLKYKTYCRIQKSRLDGVGVFAIKSIPKNTDPFAGSRNVHWHGFRAGDLLGLPPAVRKMLHDFFAVQDNQLWVPDGGLNGIDISFFMNYSKTPNVRIFDRGESFRTLRRIQSGEELTINYSLFDEVRFSNSRS